MSTVDLPSLDEHTITIAAGVDEVWPALLATVERTFSRMATYARLVGSPDHTASGPRPLAEGSTVPGFRVTSAAPKAELVLEGRHGLSIYALIFRLEQVAEGRSRLRAESRAAFPGLVGGVYRLLVVGTGGHGIGIRRLLSSVASEASGPRRSGPR